MEAWVTLCTNDSYCLGALTLAASLKRVNTSRKLVCLVSKGVSSSMLPTLNKKFDEVVNVDELDSGDAANLKLLGRQELGITFTKLRCWTLTQYSKCVFLDADTLVVQNSDELFDRDEFSAAPDAGWPDCFNSGVFVFQPSLDTYNGLLECAAKAGSFDGGDQGLLNTYFGSWATKDISKHLPFVYNMVSSASYSYLPAYQRFGGQVRIVHFIGATKPWLLNFDHRGEPIVGATESHSKTYLQLWWQIFTNEVKPSLDEHSAVVSTSQGMMGLNIGSSYRSSPPPPPPPMPVDKRENWERGQPDYQGTASFNNILKKIDQTLSKEKAPEKEVPLEK